MIKSAQTRRFGSFLVNNGLISNDDLERVLSLQRVISEKIGRLLIREGLLTEDQVMQALSEYTSIPLFNQAVMTPDLKVIKMVPESVARRAGILPLLRNARHEVLLACDGAVPKTLLQNISRLVQAPVKLVLMSERELRKWQQSVYAREYDTRIDFRAQTLDANDLNLIIELLEKILVRAVTQGNVSDIHLEPEPDGLAVRFREDGMLRRTEAFPQHIGLKLISRIKVLSNLDIAERRAPQDGAFAFKPSRLDVEVDPVNIRVSVLPVHYGEKITLRLLPPHDELISLASLGMEDKNRERFDKLLHTPHGLILVTGPTGSGKSTTLYGALQTLRSDKTNITTLEDPIELTMRGINQAQVDSNEKLGFASGLRAILRQDPDIIMLGEVRDTQTVQVVLRAAITGHLVLSTLHTNDAPSSFVRLRDMGGENFLVAVAVRGVLAQRLVRLVCPYCKQHMPVTQSELDMLGIEDMSAGQFNVARSIEGCEMCNFKGYSGRVGLYELLTVDDELRDALIHHASTSEMIKTARASGNYSTLLEDGIRKVQMGLTTPEEIARVSWQ